MLWRFESSGWSFLPWVSGELCTNNVNLPVSPKKVPHSCCMQTLNFRPWSVIKKQINIYRFLDCPVKYLNSQKPWPGWGVALNGNGPEIFKTKQNRQKIIGNIVGKNETTWTFCTGNFYCLGRFCEYILCERKQSTLTFFPITIIS